ncbi:hypothetical protein BN938_1493 [Mucinivorans hirudinis]|uniref:Uncharacterized protein n=1 Tax=Mucinivorans hirudinis TaxID=1433126 RepID=A0A060R860_9BACT|nr:hypothetical protein BN938_1493 [Mucinivorans hirudinis]
MKSFFTILITLCTLSTWAQPRFTTIEEVVEVINSKKFMIQIDRINGVSNSLYEQFGGQYFRVKPDVMDVRLAYLTREQMMGENLSDFFSAPMIEQMGEEYKMKECAIAKNRMSATTTLSSNARVRGYYFTVSYQIVAYANGTVDLTASSIWSSLRISYRGKLVKIESAEQPQLEIRIEEVINIER